MSQPVIESDWTLYSTLRQKAIERFFERKVRTISAWSSDLNVHPVVRYRQVADFIEHSESDFDRIFGENSRSWMYVSLLHMRWEKLMTTEEFTEFAESTREIVLDMARDPESYC